MLKPHARHRAPVAKRVERVVVETRDGLDVQDDDEGALRYRGEDGRRERVCRDEEEYDVDVGIGESPGSRTRLVRRIDETCVDDLGLCGETPGDFGMVAEKPVAQPFELRPVGVEPYAEKTDFCGDLCPIHFDFLLFAVQMA